MGFGGRRGTTGSLDRIRPALRRERANGSRSMWKDMGEAWNALSTLIAGVAVWGGIGYGIDHLAGTRPVLFVIGAVFGNFAGIYLVYMKYFREVPRDAP